MPKNYKKNLPKWKEKKGSLRGGNRWENRYVGSHLSEQDIGKGKTPVDYKSESFGPFWEDLKNRTKDNEKKRNFPI